VICLLIVVVIVVVLVASVVLKKRKGALPFAGTGNDADDYVAPPPPPRLPQDDATIQALAAIRQRDPAFHEAAFVDEVTRAYFQVQEAWTEQRPDLSRQVMATPIWTQHKAQIEEMVRANKRNKMVDLSVPLAYVLRAATDEFNDTLTVRFYATGQDFDIDKDTGRTVRGDKIPRGWLEDWVYQRSSRAVTKTGTLHHQCPNCGAPLTLTDDGTCQYCKVPVMAGQHDWVLTRIDQVLDQPVV